MLNESNNTREIFVDYYQGAHSPIIRINTRSRKSVRQIRELFLELAQGKLHEAEFHAAVPVKTTNISALIMKLVEKEARRTLRLVRTASEGPIFYWSRSSEGWLECADLLVGLLENNRPGHQYLTFADIDDALVELAFNEA